MALGERRFLTGPRQADTDFPGLIEEEDGTVWLVNPDGTRTQLPGAGGGGSTPSGPAGGVLFGTYPDPDFAVNMVTQAELDAFVPFGWYDAVRDFGVDNTGTTRADVAIQAAIDELETMVDGTYFFGAPRLVFPPGRYSIRDTLQWRSCQLEGSFTYTGSQFAWDGSAGGTVIQRYPSPTTGGMAFNRIANFLMTEGSSRPATFIDLSTGSDIGSIDKFGQLSNMHFIGCSSHAIKVAYWVNGHWNDLRFDSAGGFAIDMHVTTTFLNYSSFLISRFTYDNNPADGFGSSYGAGFLRIDNTDGASDLGTIKIEHARVEMGRPWTGNKAFVEIKGDVAAGCANLHLSDIALSGNGAGNSILYSNSSTPTMYHKLMLTNVQAINFTNVCGGTWWSSIKLPVLGVGHWNYLSLPVPGSPAFNIGNAGVYSFGGSPEGVITAEVGSIYTDTTNGDPYVKRTGTGSTGWVLLITEHKFGKTSVGATLGLTIAADFEQACKFTLPERAVVSSMRIYLAWNGAADSQKIKLSIWSDSTGPAALKGTTEEKTFTETLVTGWQQFNFASAVTLDAGNYWLGLSADATTSKLIYATDSVTNARKYKSTSYGSLPLDPFGAPTGTDNVEFSIYAVYQPG